MTDGGFNRDAIAPFWAAVAAEPSTLVADLFNQDTAAQHARFEGLAARLHAVSPLLCLVFGDPQARRPQIVISAGGILEAFTAVQAVVDAAPSEIRERYDVRGFRPRVPQPERLRVRVGGTELKVTDVRWDAKRCTSDPSRCDLMVFVPGYRPGEPPDSPHNEPFGQAVFALLDHLVGEFAVMTQIGAIDWHDDRDCTDLPTLMTLPTFLDRLV